MELKEFMKIEKLSEDDIIKAARIINVLCRDLSACKLCPLYNGSRCIATKISGVSIVGIVKERMKKLLNPNRMDKVAELLGVKLGEHFKISDIKKRKKIRRLSTGWKKMGCTWKKMGCT